MSRLSNQDVIWRPRLVLCHGNPDLGKVHLGRISKKGDPYLRKLLVLGATAVIRYAKSKPTLAAWINALLARRSARVVTVAVANKLARIAWAVMSRGDTFRQAASAIA